MRTPPPRNLPSNGPARVREFGVSRVLRTGGIVALLLGVGVSAAFAGSFPPRYRFQTLESGRVKVHFHGEVQGPARRVMALVLEILPGLEERYRVRVPSLDVVVHDANDSPNGLATAFPYPYVEIRAASPKGAESGPTESWLRMVVTHELTHVVHIEQAGGLYGFGRRIFGRAPFLFPNALQPAWFIEGLAVREETRGTAFGRGRHAFTGMVVDEAARGGQLEKLDKATLGLDEWPFGAAAYLYGEEFLGFVEARFGPDSTRDIASAHARAFPYLDERNFKKITGRSLSDLWREFAQERTKTLESRAPAAPASITALTHRGAIQSSPRLSPDRSTLAYNSRTLDRLGEIRLMKPDGSLDRRLTSRLSGGGLSWARDGKSIVFDETNIVAKFESRSDLHRVHVETGRRERLTHGLRASDPDVGPSVDGGTEEIAFVQRFPDRSELSILGADGDVRPLTSSSPGTEWSHPRFSPDGDAIAASRLEGGFSDLVLVDALTGAITPLTSDRALDVEPAWVDDRTLIFRSDREGGVFSLFLIGRDASGLRAVAASPRHAFTPEVDDRANRVFFARYSFLGYDLASFPYAPGEAAGVYTDGHPANFEEPPPYAGDARPYGSLPSLRPRFVSPFAELASDEWRLGLATASFDPLLRTTYGLAGSWGTQVSRPNLLGYLRYDRFTPTFTGLARLESSPAPSGRRDLREARLSVDFPIERSVLRRQTAGLTWRRRHEATPASKLDTGILALTFQIDSTRMFPMSISPQDGVRLRLAVTREFKRLGSDLEFGKAILDARAYTRIGPTVLASRLGFGFTFGSGVPLSAFAVGGLANPALLDPIGDEPALLRGYEAADGSDRSRYGRKLAFSNLELRMPLGHPQRGVRALPFFLRHLHLSASLDAAVVSARSLNLDSARVGVSIGLGADVLIGHRIPLTVQAGVGRGLTRDRATVPWFSLGFPF